MITLIDGIPLQSSEAPFKEGRKIFLPLRDVFEQMGWQVEGNSDCIVVSFSTEDSTRSTYLYEESNGIIRMHEGTAYIHSHRLAGITNALVDWDEPTNTLTITTGDSNQADMNSDYEENYEDTSDELEHIDLSDKVNLGKYSVPPALMTLIELDEELEREGFNMWNVIGFNPSISYMSYFNTPFDVVIIGTTGMDGDHFGILTEFGSATDLEEAPIVMVAPMDFDQPVKVVASNLREFIRMVMIDASLLVGGYENEQAYLKHKLEYEKSIEEQYGIRETDKDRLNR